MSEVTKLIERLFDSNGHISEFYATVLACEKEGDSFAVVLDKTAFFPEGGGQKADSGILGGRRVIDVREKGETIVHIVDAPLEVGVNVHGKIDWQQRLRRMQNHTGEHIVCGIAHKLFGCENTGFHMGTLGVTADLSACLTEDDVRKVEYIANEAVAENVEVHCEYPPAERLKTLEYRSKLDLTENVRIVTIEGYDVCACCAPHVLRTGEIGIVKILDHARYKGGTRLLMKCGFDALDDYVARCRQISAVSQLLCAKNDEIAQAVEKLREENSKLKYEAEQAERQKLKKYIDRLHDCGKNICIFAHDADFDGLREIVNAGVEMCRGVVAAFGGSDGGYKYVLGSKEVDLRELVKEFNSKLCGRGGGKPNMIQGSVSANKNEIISFLQAEEQ